MEKEGSGFDLMYDVQLSQGRSVPVTREGMDSVTVTVGRRVLRPAVIRLMADVDARYQLRQRERITLGLLMASADGLTARELANRLELGGTDELRAAWLGRLLDWGLVESAGKTQATRYFVSPLLLKGEGLDGQTTLKRVEPHRLRALIVEDLARYAGSSSADVLRRTAPELAQRTIRRALEELVEQGQVRFEGDKRWRRYWLINKGQSQ
jgi:ATP-dependent DNA helicase RecG